MGYLTFKSSLRRHYLPKYTKPKEQETGSTDSSNVPESRVMFQPPPSPAAPDLAGLKYEQLPTSERGGSSSSATQRRHGEARDGDLVLISSSPASPSSPDRSLRKLGVWLLGLQSSDALGTPAMACCNDRLFSCQLTRLCCSNCCSCSFPAPCGGRGPCA